MRAHYPESQGKLGSRENGSAAPWLCKKMGCAVPSHCPRVLIKKTQEFR